MGKSTKNAGHKRPKTTAGGSQPSTISVMPNFGMMPQMVMMPQMQITLRCRGILTRCRGNLRCMGIL